MTPSPEDRTEALLAEASFVRRLARALVRDPNTAEDVSQEVMAMAWQQRTEPRSWRNWLATLTRRLATKSRRAGQTRAQHEALAALRAHDPEQATERRLRLQSSLTDAVLGLPEPYRTIVTLRFFDGLPPREIAKRMRANGGTVRQQLRRGLALLRERLDREFGSRTQWLAAVAAIGIGSTSLPVLTLSVLMMNKLALAATVLVAASALFYVQSRFPAATPAAAVPQESAPVVEAAAVDRSESIVEREAVPMAVAERLCEVVVVGIDRAPLANVDVHCWGRDGELLHGRTDSAGIARFGASGPGGVLALRADHVPSARQFDERAGRHEVVMTSGARVSGVLSIDGIPAEPGTELPVRGEGTFEVAADLPADLQQHLQWTVPEPVVVGSNGSFVLDGLPTAWRGYLYLGQRFWLLPESGGTPQRHDTVPIARPREGLDVRTTRLPAVTGRVVWADTGEPVAGAFVDAFAKFADGSQSPGIAAECDKQGRFEIGLHPSSYGVYVQWCDPDKRPAVASVQVSANAVGAQRSQGAKLTLEQMLQGETVLQLGRSERAHFLAVDQQHKPVAGARIQAVGISEPSDGNGRGTFAGRPSKVRFVGAPGFAIEALQPIRDAAGTEQDPLVFVLRPVSRLRVRLVDSEDRPAAIHYLRIKAGQAPFAGGRMWAALDGRIYQTPINSQTIDADGTGFVGGLQMPADGKLALASLEPGVDVQLVACDRVGADVASISLTVPPAGESSDHTLRIAAPPRHIAGCVVDEHGNGIGKARLRVEHSSMTADADGNVRIYPVYATALTEMIVTAPGHVALTTKVAATDLGEQQQWTMQRARQVTLRIVDEHGQPVAVRARVDGVLAERQQLEPGVLRFDNLPAAEVQFVAWIGGDKFTLSHDARRPEASMTVPRPGLLAVAMAAWPETAAGGHLEAIATPVGRDAKPSRIWRPDRVAVSPSQLVPGRYRITLVERRGSGEDRIDVPLGLSADVNVLAGETATAALVPR